MLCGAESVACSTLTHTLVGQSGLGLILVCFFVGGVLGEDKAGAEARMVGSLGSGDSVCKH